LAFEPIRDVVAHAEPGKQRIFLEDNAAFGAGTADRRAIDEDFAVGGEESADDVEKGALAAA
jgi:hypothetical protein